MEKSTELFFKTLSLEKDDLDMVKHFFLEMNIQVKEGCDYRNDTNEDWDYYCDLVSEYADRFVDVYINNLIKNLWKFRDETYEALEQFGFNKEKWLTWVLMQGQYFYYENLLSQALNDFATYVNEK